jgi:threonine synthase
LSASLSKALADGLAPDGGLYLPQALPTLDATALEGRAALHELAPRLLAPFFAGDALARALNAICVEAFDFPAPLAAVQGSPERLSVLELFHGPTAAFKDFGARFLAACLARLHAGAGQPLTVLVATSGDTGGAVAAAFHGRPGFRVVLLYPEGRVSPVQEQQLTCWGGNVTSLAVRGSFDDCQRLVKQAFGEARLREQFALTSANSINIGRLLPQLVLFAAAALRLRDAEGAGPSFVIPSGNLGLATACAWAREIGLPVGAIVLAHNANRTVPDFLADGQWRPRASVATLASAMDVGDPSNMERLMALYPGPGAMAGRLRAVSVDDSAIRASIRAEFARAGLVLCPHSAAGLAAYRSLPEAERRGAHWVVAATAHPAKFPETVEPLLARSVDPPPALAALLGRPSRKTRIEAGIDALAAALRDSACTP